MFGKHHSEEAKQKMSTIQKGHLAWNKGLIMPESTRQKQSNALKGRHLSTETRQKLSNLRKGKTPWNKGKKFSEESRKKMSIAARNRRKRKLQEIVDTWNAKDFM